MIDVVNGWLLNAFILPSLVIFGSTLLLHRNRAFVLSTTGGFRSIMFKYLPILTIYGGYRLRDEKLMPTDRIDEDFSEIQEEFWQIYTNHGEELRHRLSELKG